MYFKFINFQFIYKDLSIDYQVAYICFFPNILVFILKAFQAKITWPIMPPKNSHCSKSE